MYCVRADTPGIDIYVVILSSLSGIVGVMRKNREFFGNGTLKKIYVIKIYLIICIIFHYNVLSYIINLYVRVRARLCMCLFVLGFHLS